MMTRLISHVVNLSHAEQQIRYMYM